VHCSCRPTVYCQRCGGMQPPGGCCLVGGSASRTRSHSHFRGICGCSVTFSFRQLVDCSHGSQRYQRVSHSASPPLRCGREASGGISRKNMFLQWCPMHLSHGVLRGLGSLAAESCCCVLLALLRGMEQCGGELLALAGNRHVAVMWSKPICPASQAVPTCPSTMDVGVCPSAHPCRIGPSIRLWVCMVGAPPR
jgi:hypothetical protein